MRNQYLGPENNPTFLLEHPLENRKQDFRAPVELLKAGVLDDRQPKVTHC